MLSERERQALVEIEQSIAASDPRLAAMLSTSRGRQRERVAWSRLAHDLVMTLAIVSAVLCVALGEGSAGMVAAIFAVVVLMARRVKFPPDANSAEGPRLSP